MARREDVRGRASRASLLVAGFLAAIMCCAMVGMAGCSCSNTNDQGNRDTQKEQKKSDAQAVPNVVGMTKDDALRVVSDNGFKAGTVTEEESDSVAAGMVMKQTPKASEQKEPGSTIDLVVSKGMQKAPVQVAVPDLSGMTQTQAEDALASVKLVPKAGDPVFKDGVEAGKIFSQSVAAGTKADEGTTVSFVVALGKEVVAVPSVVGSSKDAAVKALADAGFNVDTVESYNASVAAGCVVSQNPNPKIQCVKGTTVTLNISKGAAPAPKEQVPVPDLVTLSLPQAQNVLESAGLVCKYTGDEDGYAVAQSIAPGTNVDRGTTVTITLEELYTQGAVEGETA